MIRLMGWILMVCWVLVFLSVLVLGLVPRLAVRIPHPDLLLPVALVLVVVSIFYVIARVYCMGITRAKRNGPGGVN